MHPAFRFLMYAVLISPMVAQSSCQPTRSSKELQIAVAANTQYVMQQLIPLFENETGIDCALITGSSGKLTAQIIEGAPFDVFVSADLKYPRRLFDEGLTVDTPLTYAIGRLVLWTAIPDLEPSLELLSEERIEHIALANPKIAPYGEAAQMVLRQISFDATNKLVFGESISQTNQFIVSQSVDLGFTAKSVVRSPQLKDIGTWIEISAELHNPIQQGIVTIANDRLRQTEAKQFIDFLRSANSQKILAEYGYESTQIGL